MRRLTFISSAVLALLAGLHGGTATAADKVVIKVASYTGAKSIAANKILEPWMELVRAEAGDDLEFRTFWGGALGRAPTKQAKLLLDGITDIAFVAPNNIAGQFPQATLVQLPQLFRNASEAGPAQLRVYKKGLLDGYKGLKPLGFFASSSVFIQSTKPITKLEDLKGWKVRTSGRILKEVAGLVGATAVGSIPVFKTAEALSRGVVSASMLEWVATNTFRLYPVTKHYLVADLGVIPLQITMSDRAYNKLSAKSKAAIDKYSGAYMTINGSKAYDANAAAVEARIKKDPESTVTIPSAAETARWKKKFAPLHANMQKGMKNGKEVYTDFIAYLKEVRK